MRRLAVFALFFLSTFSAVSAQQSVPQQTPSTGSTQSTTSDHSTQSSPAKQPDNQSPSTSQSPTTSHASPSDIPNNTTQGDVPGRPNTSSVDAGALDSKSNEELLSMIHQLTDDQSVAAELQYEKDKQLRELAIHRRRVAVIKQLLQ
jgi:hypothetical protein